MMKLIPPRFRMQPVRTMNVLPSPHCQLILDTVIKNLTSPTVNSNGQVQFLPFTAEIKYFLWSVKTKYQMVYRVMMIEIHLYPEKHF